MTNEINEAVSAIIERLEKTEKFVIDQAPEICKQMLEEERITVRNNMILEVAGLTFLLALLVGSPVVFFAHGEADSWWKFASEIAFLTAVAVFFPVLSELMGSITRLQILKRAPKLFLLRKFRMLLK